MNVLFNAGQMAVGYLFPQVGVALRGAGWARTAYNVVKAVAGIFSGNAVGVAAAAVGGSCEEIRDACIQRVMFNGPVLDPDDAQTRGGAALVCWAGYFICKLFG